MNFSTTGFRIGNAASRTASWHGVSIDFYYSGTNTCLHFNRKLQNPLAGTYKMVHTSYLRTDKESYSERFSEKVTRHQNIFHFMQNSLKQAFCTFHSQCIVIGIVTRLPVGWATKRDSILGRVKKFFLSQTVRSSPWSLSPFHSVGSWSPFTRTKGQGALTAIWCQGTLNRGMRYKPQGGGFDSRWGFLLDFLFA